MSRAAPTSVTQRCDDSHEEMRVPARQRADPMSARAGARGWGSGRGMRHVFRANLVARRGRNAPPAHTVPAPCAHRHTSGCGVARRFTERGNYISRRSQQQTMNSSPNQRTSRIKRAFSLALVVVSVLAAGVLPTCGDGFCCSVESAVPTVHAQMPCCASPSFAPRDVSPSRAVTTLSAGSLTSPRMWAPAALVTWSHASVSPSRVQATLATASTAHPEPTPPLFLLNAQFLI